ncbi:hypothetical protein BGZ65_005925, partial [Modicella reniformis]
AKPTKLHWGADTTLGILNTITITDTSQDIPYSSAGSSSSLASSWRAALKRVAAMAKGDLARYHDQDTNLDTGQETIEPDNSGALSPPSSSRSLEPSTRKRGHKEENDQVSKRSRSRTRSRSRSVTPIDSYSYCDNDSFNPHMDSQASSSFHPDLSYPKNNTSISPSIPTRRQVYALEMLPHPVQDYPLTDRIVAADMVFLAPFLERDLVVLTDADPGPVNPLVLAHVKSLFITHGSVMLGRDNQAKARWDLIEVGVAEWVTMTPGNERTAVLLARQFVEEMRRVVQKRWKPGQWGANVRYRTTASPSASTTASCWCDQICCVAIFKTADC